MTPEAASTPKRGIAKAYERMNQEMAERPIELVAPSWEEMKKRIGRPPTYTPDCDETAFRLLTDPNVCHTLRSVASMLYVNIATLYRWIEEYPTFRDAIAHGKQFQEAKYATRMVNGFKYAQGMIFTMKNLHGWTDKIEQTTTIQLGKALADHGLQAKPVEWQDIETAPGTVLVLPVSSGASANPSEEEDREHAQEPADDEHASE